MGLKLLGCICENRHMYFCSKYLFSILTQKGDLKIIQFKEDSFIIIYVFRSSQLLSCLAEQLCASKLYLRLVKMWKNNQALGKPRIPLPPAVFDFFPSYSLSRLYFSPKTVANVVYIRHDEKLNKLERPFLFCLFLCLRFVTGTWCCRPRQISCPLQLVL